jgi:putative endonuclease
MKDKKEWKVYLLRCRDGSLYCGITKDVEKRIEKHRSGNGSKYVRSRLPVKVVYTEDGHTRSTALKREHEIKSYSKQKKERLVKE